MWARRWAATQAGQLLCDIFKSKTFLIPKICLLQSLIPNIMGHLILATCWTPHLLGHLSEFQPLYFLIPYKFAFLLWYFLSASHHLPSSRVFPFGFLYKVSQFPHTFVIECSWTLRVTKAPWSFTRTWPS